MEDEDLISISALQHYSYCPRQCALIHAEQVFDENIFTLRGRVVHANVDKPQSNIRGAKSVERALPLFCKRLGLVGKADLVEFLADGTPYPVEYKHGPKREHKHDELQLAAQAICLEEMTGKVVDAGAIFHYSSRKRRNVQITPDLKRQVEISVAEIRSMLSATKLPTPVNDSRCRDCSLRDACQPEALSDSNRQKRIWNSIIYSESD